MFKPLKAHTGKLPDPELAAVRAGMAEHMIGTTVDLLTGRKVVHGIVTGVLTEAGKPKIVVNGRRFDISQVLTVLPATI